MISYRHYHPGDEQQIIALWNTCLRQDPISQGRFRRLILLDANFDPEGLQLAFEDDQLVGCVYAVRRLMPLSGADLEEENGWIPFFFVAESYRRKGVGTKLMQHAMQFLNKLGRKQVFFASYAPNYILPGIDEEAYPEAFHYLLAQGFEKQYSPVAMDRSLVGYSYPQEVEQLKQTRQAEGYTFTTLQDQDIYEAISFANNVFNPDWGRAIREGLLQGLPLNRVLITRFEGKLVGFCMYGGYDGIPERFGPFGVDPEQQGKGLGKILLHECLRYMRAEGLHGAWFLWTGEKSSAGHLYHKVDFHITRRFHVMKKSI